MKTRKALVALAAAALVAALAVPGVALATGNPNGHYRGQGPYAAQNENDTSEPCAKPGSCMAQNECAAQGAFIDEDGDGMCDNRGTRAGFADEDGDGMCDNRSGNCPNRQNSGQGCGNGACGGTGAAAGAGHGIHARTCR